MPQQRATRFLLCAAALLGLASCAASGAFTPRADAVPYHTPREAQQVELLSELPARPYTELGTVRVHGHYFHFNESMIRELKTEAGRHGADAVIIYQGINTHPILSPEWNDDRPREAQGIAIRYTDTKESAR